MSKCKTKTCTEIEINCRLWYVDPTLFMNPIEGDLKGYCSGRWTRTFHTPPSYGVPLGPKNLTTNSSRPPRMVTSCLDSISLITSVSIRRLPADGDDILNFLLRCLFVTLVFLKSNQSNSEDLTRFPSRARLDCCCVLKALESWMNFTSVRSWLWEGGSPPPCPHITTDGTPEAPEAPEGQLLGFGISGKDGGRAELRKSRNLIGKSKMSTIALHFTSRQRRRLCSLPSCSIFTLCWSSTRRRRSTRHWLTELDTADYSVTAR